MRSDGRLALATTSTDKGQLVFDIAFGHYREKTKRIEWSSHQALGTKIEAVGNGINIVQANIQDLMFREHSGVVQLILKEQVNAGNGITGLASTLKPHLRKSIVAIDEDYGVLAKMDLDVGNLLNRTDSVLLGEPEVAFDDLSDDFLQLPEQAVYEFNGEKLEHYQREFFSVGDYGIVIFAEVVEKTNLHGPAWGIPTQPTPPQPAAATSSTTVGATVPAAGLTLVGALSLALLANKRKEVSITKARK